ncbi:hypothetical protein [Aquimarina agarilytica]|uniref:hypothetical protein n=1 Tax=Aquimarina agarilytica TaxID=1087449 RepID=UPI0002D293CD|nr:hypothetical protein [Aquimarina agarilytica]
MRVLLYILITSLFTSSLISQTLDANATMGLPTVTNLTDITGTPNEGNIVYVTSDDRIYRFDGTNWIADTGTDDQFDDEVELRTPIDVNNLPTDPNASNETDIQEVIQAITPITSKNGRVFYPPSVQIDASINGTFTLNLYDQYVAQHSGAGIIRSTIAGVAAPDIPIYNVDELYYYVTFADPSVFSNISIDGDTGIMTYTIVGQPTDFNSLINVVFVVK